MQHPTKKFEFGELYDGLLRAKGAKLVSESAGPNGLFLYCYTNSCVYDRAWDDVTLSARGLIISPSERRVVATPFPKFFNVGEREETIPSLGFETFEKLDGSLIIIYHHEGRWNAATKGSFRSDQAAWAQEYLARSDLSLLVPGTTYLAEYVGPSNRIVVRYPSSQLVMLAAYDSSGIELQYQHLVELSSALGWPIAKRHSFRAVSDLLVMAKDLPPNEEGFVLRFENGHRLKVKGDEYRRIHALVSHLTPLAMWEAMLAQDDMEKIRRDLPEEFWGDFDQITGLLGAGIGRVTESVRREADAVAELSDKEVGLRLGNFPEEVRGLIFPYRRQNGDLLNGRARRVVFNAVRPTANRLPGYDPSSTMARVFEEAI